MSSNPPSAVYGRRAPCALLALLLLAGCASDPQDLPPERLVALAAEELARYEFASAHAHLTSALALRPDAALRRRAAFALAVTCHQWQPASPERIAEAETLYRELAEAGAGDEAPRALLYLGRIAELRDFYGDAEDLAKARGIYRELMRRWPERPEAGEACLRLAGAYAQTLAEDDVRQAIGVLDAWLAEHPQERLGAIMLQYLSELHWSFRRDARRAVDALIAADRRGFDCENREWQYCWRIARLAEEELGDRALAVRYYERIVTAYPRSGAAWNAQQELRRLGVEPPPIRLFDPTAAARSPRRPAVTPAAAPGGKGVP